jgi:hypothetical protein
MYEPQLREFSKFVFHGLARQLTSQPVDLRVEREVYEGLPEHRSRQLAYLERQLRDLEPHFTPEIAEFAPPRVYRAGSGMNVALGLGFAEIADATVPGAVLENGYRYLGDRLQGLLGRIDGAGLAGDREAVDAWAEELGLRDWYQWVAHGSAP